MTRIVRGIPALARPLQAAIVTLALLSGSASWAAEDALFQSLGGEAGITRIVDGLIDRAYADVRIKEKFAGTKAAALKESIRKQICQITGGPCVYDGETMKNSHAQLGLTKADFNALVEDLQAAMDEQQVPFTVQNKLLALLAPMHRDIITK